MNLIVLVVLFAFIAGTITVARWLVGSLGVPMWAAIPLSIGAAVAVWWLIGRIAPDTSE